MLDCELHIYVSLSDFRSVYVCEKFVIQQIFIGANLCWIHLLQFYPICTEFSQGFIVSEKTGGKCRNLS